MKKCEGCKKLMKRVVHNLKHRKRAEFCSTRCMKAYKKQQITLGNAHAVARLAVYVTKEEALYVPPVFTETMADRDEQYRTALRRHYNLKEK